MVLRLALVAVIGRPKRVTSEVANSAAGHRRPIVPVPAVSFAESDEMAGNMTVSGPGQNRSARR
jgi:hypothetical protein